MPGEYAVIVEGKFDFHPLSYFKERLKVGTDIGIFPAPSASEAGTLISLMRGLGTTFVVMLDDDKAGRQAAKRYREDHLLSEDQVFTLAALDPKLSGKTFEGLYSTEVEKLANSEGTVTKGEYSLLFQRLRIEENHRIGLGNTTVRIKAILGKLEAALKPDSAVVAKSAPRKVLVKKRVKGVSSKARAK